jgi:hypothetical protein
LEVGIQENPRRLFFFFGFFCKEATLIGPSPKKIYWHMIRHISRLVVLDHKFCESLRRFVLFVGSQIECEDDLGLPGITHFQRVECNRYLH